MYSEWKNLVEGAKSGEETLKLEILDRLTPLIISSIKHYYNKKSDYEELIQEGKECILVCIRDYEEGKGSYFLGYVKMKLKHLYLNKHREKQHLSLNVEVGDEAKEEMVNLIPSSLKSPLEGIIEDKLGKRLAESMKQLTLRQKQVILLFYVERISIGDIASRLGVKYRTVVNTKTAALKKLAKNLEKEIK